MAKKSQSFWFAIVMLLLLVGTNLFWFFGAIDTGITAAYRDTQLVHYKRAMEQAFVLIPALKSNSDRDELVAFLEAASETTAFQKDGCTWVGNLGLKFDQNGYLIHVTSTSNMGEQDPCFP